MTVAEDRMAVSTSRRVVAPRMVGRGSELEAVAATLTEVPGLAIIEGEAGIGKSRLVAELAEHEAIAGRRWLIGSCRRVREPFPMGPVIEALRHLGDDLPGLRLTPLAGALRSLLPELSSWLPLAPDPLEDKAAERHRVFRALSELFHALGPTVLVLEDLHWADEQTVEFLAYLITEPPQRLAVVATFRPEDVAHDVRSALTRIPADMRYHQVTLTPLDVEQTAGLASSILETERVSTEFAEHLCQRASGVPLAIEELLAVLRERGSLVREGSRWARQAVDELDVPAGIRDPVLERVSGLTDQARAVVEAAAVLGEPFPVEVVGSTCGMSDDETPVGVEQALSGHVLTERGALVGFRHALAAQAVYDAMPQVRRTVLHTRAAEALADLDPCPLGQLAYHLKHAERLDEWADVAEQAANRASKLGDDAEAVRLLQDVLRHARLTTLRRGTLAIKLGRAAHETYRSSEGLIELLSGAVSDDLPPATRGELAFYVSTAVQDMGGDPELKRHWLKEAVEYLDDQPALQAWAMVGLGLPAQPKVPLQEHRVWLNRAHKTLPDVDDPDLKIFLLGKLAMTFALIGDPAWREFVDRIERLTSGRPTRRAEVSAYQSIGMIAASCGHLEIARSFLDRALEGARQCRSAPLELSVRSALGLLDYCSGRWDGLIERVDGLLAELADDPLSGVDLEVVSAGLALAKDGHGAIHERLPRLADQLAAMGLLDLLSFVVDILGHAESGGSETSLVIADRFLAELDSKDMWAPAARALPSMVRLMVGAQQLARATQLVARVRRELTDLDVPLGPAAVSHAAGIVAAAEENRPEAARSCMDAAEMYAALGSPYEAARARETAFEAMCATGDNRAEPTILESLSDYQQLGATWDHARCVRLARSHGIRVPALHKSGRKGYGDALSPREQDVARLAASGMTNRQIADELFLSPTTVSKHLIRAMRKLGVHSRAAVAGQLAERTPG